MPRHDNKKTFKKMVFQWDSTIAIDKDMAFALDIMEAQATSDYLSEQDRGRLRREAQRKAGQPYLLGERIIDLISTTQIMMLEQPPQMQEQIIDQRIAFIIGQLKIIYSHMYKTEAEAEYWQDISTILKNSIMHNYNAEEVKDYFVSFTLYAAYAFGEKDPRENPEKDTDTETDPVVRFKERRGYYDVFFRRIKGIDYDLAISVFDRVWQEMLGQIQAEHDRCKPHVFPYGWGTLGLCASAATWWFGGPVLIVAATAVAGSIYGYSRRNFTAEMKAFLKTQAKAEFEYFYGTSKHFSSDDEDAVKAIGLKYVLDRLVASRHLQMKKVAIKDAEKEVYVPASDFYACLPQRSAPEPTPTLTQTRKAKRAAAQVRAVGRAVAPLELADDEPSSSTERRIERVPDDCLLFEGEGNSLVLIRGQQEGKGYSTTDILTFIGGERGQRVCRPHGQTGIKRLYSGVRDAYEIKNPRKDGRVLAEKADEDAEISVDGQMQTVPVYQVEASFKHRQ